MTWNERESPEVTRALGKPRKRRRSPLEDDPPVDESTIEELAVLLASDAASDLGSRSLFGEGAR